MPLIRINADGDTPRAMDGADPDRILAETLHALPADAPVVVLIHGFSHSPAATRYCPHRTVLSLAPVRGNPGAAWPLRMGFGSGDPGAGLAIAFGWEARGTIWTAHRRASDAGRALARLIRRVRTLRIGPVDILAHSLGARVALSALSALPPYGVGRMILLSGAELRGPAAAAMKTQAGATAEVLNVASRANLAFDLAFERLLQGPSRYDRAIGAGLSPILPNWTDLRIDCARTRAHLAHQGHTIAHPAAPVCHSATYSAPGLFSLYTALIRNRAALPLSRLCPPPPTPRRPSAGPLPA